MKMILRGFINDKIKINDIDKIGWISAITVYSDNGIRYECRYFHNSELKSVWLFGNEFDLLKGKNGYPMGFKKQGD